MTQLENAGNLVNNPRQVISFTFSFFCWLSLVFCHRRHMSSSLNMDEIQWWHPDDWAQALAPLQTGEAQRAYFARSATSAYQYVEVKQKILGRLGLSPICVAQYFYEWEYKPRLPAVPRPPNSRNSRNIGCWKGLHRPVKWWNAW